MPPNFGGGTEAGQVARNDQNKATDLYSQIAQQGNALTTQGNTLYNNAAGQLGPLISKFSAAAGLGGTNGQPGGQTPSTGQRGGTTTPSGSNGQPSGNTAGGSAGANTPGGGASAPIPQNLADHSMQNPSFDPYQLDSNQQQYLSSQLDSMNQQISTQVQQFHSSLAASGINDSEAAAAGESYLKQQGQLQQNQFVTQFMETQRANKEAAIASLITLASQQEGLGIQTEQAGLGTQEAGAGGIAGIGAANANQSSQQSAQGASEAIGAGSFVTSLLPTSWFKGTGLGNANS